MSKIIKISLISLASLVGLLLILWAIMQTHAFQNYLAKKLSKYFSDELQTKVEIASLKVRYFDHLELKEVLMLDQESDTMFYIGVLDANYDFWTWNSQFISFDKVELINADVKIGVPENEASLNLQFVIDYVTPDSSSTSESPTIAIDHLVLEGCRFNYFDRNLDKPSSRSFNENDMVFDEIHADLKDFTIINDSISFLSKSLSSRENCGLEISNLKGDIIISSTLMQFDQFQLLTPVSTLQDYLAFHYKSFRDLSDFVSMVQIDAKLKGSQIHTSDLEYFSIEMEPYNDLISADGKIRGTIDNLRGEELDLKIGTRSSFTGKVRIKGIPDMPNSYWDIDATALKTESVTLGQYLQLGDIPKELIAVGNMQFSGKFQGFLREFVCYGKLRTSLGDVETDVKFGVNPDGLEEYSGKLKSGGVNLAPLLSYNSVGKAGFDLTVSGAGLELEKMSADVAGSISYIEFNDYPFRSIEIDGNLKEDLFTGYASIRDPNLNLEFEGVINASIEHPTIKVYADANTINLKTLGLDTKDSYLTFKGEINLEDLEDDVYGVVHLDSISFERQGKVYPLKDVDLIASTANENSEKQILMHSDLLSLQLTGEYTVLDLPAIAESIIYYVVPHDGEQAKPHFPPSNIALKAEIPKYHPILAQYIPEIGFEGAFIELAFDSEADVMHSKGWISSPAYLQYESDSLIFSFDRISKYKPLESSIQLYTIHTQDTFLLEEILFTGSSLDKKMDFMLSAHRDSGLNAKVDASLVLNNDSIEVYIHRLKAQVNAKEWYMNSTDFANVVYHNEILELLYIDLRNGEEIIFVDAIFEKDQQRMSVVLDNFLLDNANPFLTGVGVNLGGKANGVIDIKYLQSFPIVESDLSISDLAYDGDTLGQFLLKTITGTNPLELIVSGQLENGLVDMMNIDGRVDFNDPENALNVQLLTAGSPISAFEPYLEGLASNLEGVVTADLVLSGPLKKPQLSGRGSLSQLKFKVDYLQTIYTSEAEIEVGNDFFRFTKAHIADRFGKRGNVVGSISHQNFDHFRFDIDIEDLKDFECLNTGRDDNELFFGTAYADGSMKIEGPLEDILLQIEAKSRKGTKIFIPLDNSETEGQLSYVQFVEFNKDNSSVRELVKTSDGVRLDFNFEVTNDADIELIFDELLGDIIKGNGHGNLRMEINTYGDFNMYGDLTIDRGNYLFTAFNFINKYFSIEPGGTLKWDGDPYNATIDLIAVKREYPVPATLLAGMVTSEDLELYYSEPVPVDCKLHLTGLLFNPNVQFDLSFPNASGLAGSSTSTFTTVIERIRQDQDELNRQVFALIALGSFIPPSFSAGGILAESSGTPGLQNSVNNNLSDFVSNQLSNWLAQIDSKFQFGVDYQGATDISRAEIIISIKRKFANDRLELQGSVDVNSPIGSNLYDLNFQYDLSDDGTFKLKGFHRNANDPTLGNLSNLTTSGIGLFYRHQFDYFWFNKPKDQDTTKQ